MSSVCKELVGGELCFTYYYLCKYIPTMLGALEFTDGVVGKVREGVTAIVWGRKMYHESDFPSDPTNHSVE